MKLTVFIALLMIGCLCMIVTSCDKTPDIITADDILQQKWILVSSESRPNIPYEIFEFKRDSLFKLTETVDGITKTTIGLWELWYTNLTMEMADGRVIHRHIEEMHMDVLYLHDENYKIDKYIPIK